MKKWIAYIGLMLTLTACTKEVKIDIPGYEKKMVVDGNITVGQPPVVMLSTTKDIYAPTDLNTYLNGFISDAVVTVSDGTQTVQLDLICSDNLPVGTEEIAAELFGIPIEKLAEYHLCAYTTFNTSIWGEVGKTYTLNIQYEGKTYTSSTILNQPTSLDAVYWKPDGDKVDYGYSWAKLSDNPSTYDAYMWEVKRINTGTDGNPIDNIFTKTFAPVFDDQFINGLTFDFFFENPMNLRDTTVAVENRGLYQIGDTVVIKFSKMDKPVYKYMEKKYAQLATQGNPFATPINIPSNISGGALGVWAGYSPSFDTLICQ